MSVLEVYWSWALSLMCEVALSSVAFVYVGPDNKTMRCMDLVQGDVD
jgi:hypothetical protein